jgi:hypothetical protein
MGSYPAGICQGSTDLVMLPVPTFRKFVVRRKVGLRPSRDQRNEEALDVRVSDSEIRAGEHSEKAGTHRRTKQNYSKNHNNRCFLD